MKSTTLAKYADSIDIEDRLAVCYHAVEHGLNLVDVGNPGGAVTPTEAYDIALQDVGLIAVTGEADITDAQIEALRAEAGAAGDEEQVVLCDQALAGDLVAALECAAVIADAEAQDEYTGTDAALRSTGGACGVDGCEESPVSSRDGLPYCNRHLHDYAAGLLAADAE